MNPKPKQENEPEYQSHQTRGGELRALCEVVQRGRERQEAETIWAEALQRISQKSEGGNVEPNKPD